MFTNTAGLAAIIAAASGVAAQAQTSPPAPFVTKVWSDSGQNSSSGRACVDAGYKLVGGGASVEGAGNPLMESYPNAPNNCWYARARVGGLPMTVWAVGVADTGNQWDVVILANHVPKGAPTFPRVTISLSDAAPKVLALTGGGAHVEDGGIAASYPSSLQSWEAVAEGSAKSVTSYIIGIRPAAGGALTAAMKSATAAAPVATLDPGYSLTGGGARVDSGTAFLNKLTPSPTNAPDNKSWAAGTPGGGGQVTARAVGIYSDVTLTGCTEANIINSCLALKTAGNVSYNVEASPAPDGSKRVSLKGTVRSGIVANCPVGSGTVEVTSWEYVSGTCP